MGKLEKFDKFNKVNESSIDYDILSSITKLPCYNELREKFKNAIAEFTVSVDNSNIGYDEGDSDHDLALNSAIQEAIDEFIGW